MFQVPRHRAPRDPAPRPRLVADLFAPGEALPGVEAGNRASSALDGADGIAIAIGRDHARFGLTPPIEHLTDGHPVRLGWEDGVARFRRRTRPARPQVREWLALRLSAWLEGAAFDELHVTPHYLRQLHPAVCPVLRQALTHHGAADTDAVVVRLRPDLGYQVGTLAVVGRRAVAPLQALLRDLPSRLARHDPLEPFGPGDALTPAERDRLLALAALATPLPHVVARELPMLVLPPNRLHVVNPAQCVQLLLTMLVAQPAFARRMADLAAHIASAPARRVFHAVAHTLLARRVEAGFGAAAPDLRRRLEDSWRHPLVVQRWRQFASSLDDGAMGALADRAVRSAQGRGASSGQGYSR